MKFTHIAHTVAVNDFVNISFNMTHETISFITFHLILVHHIGGVAAYIYLHPVSKLSAELWVMIK